MFFVVGLTQPTFFSKKLVVTFGVVTFESLLSEVYGSSLMQSISESLNSREKTTRVLGRLQHSIQHLLKNSYSLSRFSKNLLAFYDECRLRIGYATSYLFKQQSVSVEELSADSCPAEI